MAFKEHDQVRVRDVRHTFWGHLQGTTAFVVESPYRGLDGQHPIEGVVMIDTYSPDGKRFFPIAERCLEIVN